MSQMTSVQIHFVKDIYNHRLRFGTPDDNVRLDSYRKLALFGPSKIFGYIRWRGNKYGTQDWRVYVLKSGSKGCLSMVPGIEPAAKILLSIHGTERVKRTLKIIDSLEGNPVKLDVLSRMALDDLPEAMGKTWLDSELQSNAAQSANGFGAEVEAAKAQRRQYLLSQKLISEDGIVTDETLRNLEKIDLDNLGKALSSVYGKTYSPAPISGRISGTYREAIHRPSGKYAIIEKSQEFSLVPWRETMDRNLGKSISGIVKGQTISWTLTKGIGRSIS